MPYTTNSELPKAVRGKLSDHQQTIFRNVFNSMMGEDGMTESRAFAGAWSKAKAAPKPVMKAEYQGHQVELDKPFRLPAGSSKKFGVYVKDGDKVKKVTFGDPNMEIRRDNPEARANFRSRMGCDTETDKTSANYWSCKMWEAGSSVSDMVNKEEDFDIQGQILKVDNAQRMVYGWASVITENGIPVVDTQGDVIKAETLVKAATEFMLSARIAKDMHSGGKIGEFVHSMPLTKEIADALGVTSDKEGWIVACKVYDNAVWEKVKSGELKAFSIGGRAKREKIQ
jgi:cation transport regulator ChaB